MPHSSSKLTSSWRRALAGAAAAAAVCTSVAAPARAHFTLDAPASWMSQDFIGSPQKAPPCGDETGGTPTGTVTAFGEGDTITITIDEKIFHPGHYRIALAVNDPSELPAEPLVTPAATPCGSVEIMNPPVYPVLADGVFPHTAAFSGPQTTTVKLPPGVTCTKCTLQVIEFMSNHGLNVPGGCFYHHCANISISGGTTTTGSTTGATTSSGATTGATTGAATTGATTGAGGAGGAAGAGGSGGGTSMSSGCSVPGGDTRDATPLAGVASLLALVALRRRQR
jgi:MYXO-CTERM domain-containing protein